MVTKSGISSAVVSVFYIFLMSFTPSVHAAPKAELWSYWDQSDENSTQMVDHGKWRTFLATYLSKDATGNALVKYAQVDPGGVIALKSYVAELEQMNPLTLNREEQMAYWINLYNAATVRLILENYPLKSITKLGGWLSFGPWDDPVLKVNGEALTLNDIEHRILRPIWKDSRIHYAVNCASIGCPNLYFEPFLASALDRQLDQAAKTFINSSKGVSIQGESVTLSSIYDWYRVDFGDKRSLTQHLLSYLEPEAHVARELRKRGLEERGVDYAYDWALNEPNSR